MIDSTELMVSEVVTNAVRFASRPIALRLLRTDVLRCEVADDSPKSPECAAPPPPTRAAGASSSSTSSPAAGAHGG